MASFSATPMPLIVKVCGVSPLLYRLGGEDRFLIWISDAKGSFIVDAEGFIQSFAKAAVLRAYADQNHNELEDEEAILHDLDWFALWTKAPNAQIVPTWSREEVASLTELLTVGLDLFKSRTRFYPVER